MCGRHKHGGYCCSQQPWQHAYCFVVKKGLPPWHNTITAPGDVSGHQRQLGPAGNLARSQHAAIPGTRQGQSGLRDPGQLGGAPAVEALNDPEGRAESGTCVRGQHRADEVMLLLVMPMHLAYVLGNTEHSLGLSQYKCWTGGGLGQGGGGRGAEGKGKRGFGVLQSASAGRCGTSA